MVTAGPRTTWEVRVATARGARHVKIGAPNQDAADWYRSPDGETAIVCVADGHGSRHSFRADIGASLAVEAGLSALRELLEDHRSSSLSAIREAAAGLPQRVLTAWTRHVRQHSTDNPIGSEELKRAGVQADLTDGGLMVAYGATLLAVAVTPGFALLAQLGDGDIVWRQDGRVLRPLGSSTHPLGDETVSLASGSLALDEWRVAVQAWTSLPDLIMVATDGYANSFASDDGFLTVAEDLHSQIAEHGLGRISDQLPAWLRTTSREGSGDDITVGLLVSDRSASMLGQQAGVRDADVTKGDRDGGHGGADEPAHNRKHPPRRRVPTVIGVAVGGALVFVIGVLLGWAIGYASSPNLLDGSPSPTELVDPTPPRTGVAPPLSP